MKTHCTNLFMAAAATSVLALGGMVHADQAAMTAPGRAMPKAGATPISGAPLIWDNGGPDGTNGISHFQGNLDGVPYNRDLSDDFTTGSSASGWQVTGVQMSGVWFAASPAPGPLTGLRVRIWEDSGGTPAEAALIDTTVGFVATNTGGTYFGRPEVSYQAAVDFTLDGDTTYWIGIQPVGTTDNFFQLTSAADVPPPPPATCVGFCGGQSSGGCWCDEDCCGFADCCPDKFAVCGGCQPLGGAGAALLGEEIRVRGDFTPPLPTWTPGSVVFTDSYDITFKIYGMPATGGDCPADINGDNVVDVSDLLALLAAWGPNPGHAADINEDGVVDVSDLLALLAAWGPCPGPPAPTGACCFSDGPCMPDLTAVQCADLNGNYGGNFSSCASCPNGQSCLQALALAPGQTLNRDTTGNPAGSGPACGGVTPGGSPTIWFAVDGTGSLLTVQVDTGISGPGSAVAVYCNSCASLVCVAGGTANSSGDNPFDGEATWCATGTHTYYIAVWRTGAAGDVAVSLTQGGNCTPTVDCDPPAGNSCVGSCGAQAPAGCWCDESCCGFGDCCDDKTAACGGCQWPPITTGACCVGPTCTDNVEGANCTGIHYPGQTCAEVGSCPSCDSSASSACAAQFIYDDCTTENALGLTAGGVISWAQRYNAGGGAVINNIATSYANTGTSNPGVTACQPVGWAIMTDSGAGPGTVIAQGVGEIAAEAIASNKTQVIPTGGVAVSGSFYVVVWVQHASGWPAPMDQGNPGPFANDVWLMYVVGGTFGAFNPEAPEAKLRMSDIGFPSIWLLRANQ